MADTHTKFLLDEDAIPTHWVNLLPDLPGDPLPPLHPGTMAPAGPEDLGAIFPMALILQEVSAEPEVEVPEAVREAYKLWRPTPLYRARRLEAELDTPARIYYKYEGVSPAGSHKPNTAVPQAYENAQAGIRKLTHRDRRGAVGLVAGLRVPALRPGVRGLHGRLVLRPEALPALDDADVGRDGAPLALARRRSPAAPTPARRPGRWGSPSPRPSRSPPRTRTPTTRSGSVLNHVLLHQTVIGQESIAQMELAGDKPDVVVGCVGGGSNFAGLAYPWLRRKLRSGSGPRFLAAEPAACPTLTQGVYAYDFGDTAGLTPLMPMYTLGHGFVPPPVHAGGLRYHGDAPSLCALVGPGRSRRAPSARTRPSRRRCASRAPRGSSRRPSRRTRSAR